MLNLCPSCYAEQSTQIGPQQELLLGSGFRHDFKQPPAIHEILSEVALQVELEP